jgi:hypothetical protein
LTCPLRHAFRGQLNSWTRKNIFLKTDFPNLQKLSTARMNKSKRPITKFKIPSKKLSKTSHHYYSSAKLSFLYFFISGMCRASLTGLANY